MCIKKIRLSPIFLAILFLSFVHPSQAQSTFWTNDNTIPEGGQATIYTDSTGTVRCSFADTEEFIGNVSPNNPLEFNMPSRFRQGASVQVDCTFYGDDDVSNDTRPLYFTIVQDACPNGTAFDSIGNDCDHDEDNDGWLDGDDRCTYEPSSTNNGCPPSTSDSQTCPDGTARDSYGSPCDHDEDNDAVPDNSDDCPYEDGEGVGCWIDVILVDNFSQYIGYLPYLLGGFFGLWFFFGFLPGLFHKPDPVAPVDWPSKRPPHRKTPPHREPPSIDPADKAKHERDAHRRIDETRNCQEEWQCKIEDPELELQLYTIESLTLKVWRLGKQGKVKEYKFAKKSCNSLNAAYYKYFLTHNFDALHKDLAPVARDMYGQIDEWLRELDFVSYIEIDAELKGSGAKVKYQVYRCTGGRWDKFGMPWEAKVQDEREVGIIVFPSFHVRSAPPSHNIGQLNAGLDQFVQEM
jgi:hypothetical protein